MTIDSIFSYFPNISEQQKEQFERLPALYREWNQKINVVSRKDIDNIVCNHILHSLSIAKFITFKEGTTILDIGTGGGFPGIPLAIMFPESDFTLVDSIGKKLKVVENVSAQIGIKNVRTIHTRAENMKERFQFIVSRAALQMPILAKISKHLIDKKNQKNGLPNGIIALKGGDLTDELKEFSNIVSVESISDYFNEPFFETKKIVYLPL